MKIQGHLEVTKHDDIEKSRAVVDKGAGQNWKMSICQKNFRTQQHDDRVMGPRPCGWLWLQKGCNFPFLLFSSFSGFVSSVLLRLTGAPGFIGPLLVADDLFFSPCPALLLSFAGCAPRGAWSWLTVLRGAPKVKKTFASMFFAGSYLGWRSLRGLGVF